MLLSRQFRFIFAKTRKSAGTSIEADLSEGMRARNLVTLGSTL